jgi:hypothetical protein
MPRGISSKIHDQDFSKVIKYCKCCNELLKREIYKNKPESMANFLVRKFCSKKCRILIKSLPRKKTNKRASNQHAQYILRSVKECEGCGKINTLLDVHHIDGNDFNNTINNIIKLCRSCHSKQHRTVKKCIICDNRHNDHGYCTTHSYRVRKYGNPYFTLKGLKKINILLNSWIFNLNQLGFLNLVKSEVRKNENTY